MSDGYVCDLPSLLYLSGGVVLGAVARADELVFRLVPRHDASQVSAHSHDTVVLDGLVLLHHQVRCVTLTNSGTDKNKRDKHKTAKRGASMISEQM